MKYMFDVGVLPERQKVMFAGVTINDHDWGKAKEKIKDVCDGYIILIKAQVTCSWKSGQ